MGLLERFGQKIEERLPQRGLYGMKPPVEATLGDRLVDVSVLLEERAGPLDVPTEEGGCDKGCAHHLGGGKADLLVVAVAYRLQELLA